MKSFTDLNQSKKLAEILSPESADMYWWSSGKRYYIEAMDDGDFNEAEGHIRAWSLAALLDAVDFSTINLHYNNTRIDWVASATIHDSTKHCTKYESTKALNPVDACVEMIEKLHEQKLL